VRRKPIFWVAVAAAAALVLAVAVWGKQYYENRYVGSDYYVMVPMDYDMEAKPILSMNGAEVGRGVKYALTAYGEGGEPKAISFTVHDPDSPGARGERQPQPGEYLRVSASRQIVLRWEVIGPWAVPEGAMRAIVGR